MEISEGLVTGPPCPFCGEVHAGLCEMLRKGAEMDKDATDYDPSTDERLDRFFAEDRSDLSRENRIEALRAASRIVAGTVSSGKNVGQKLDDGSVEVVDLSTAALEIAEQFVRYIEDGKR